LLGKIKVKGLTLVPIRVYTRKRLIKLEFGVGRGKKEYDKREDIKQRESKRKTKRILRNIG
jgi:SsrA-binding protein